MLDLYIDRSLPLTLAEQIKGQLVYAIMCGRLRPGQELPSVRRLAQTLNVSSATITQVYRALAQEHLICAQAGRGTFVEEIGRAQSKSAAFSVEQSLHQILNACIRLVLGLGYSVDELGDEFLIHLETHRPGNLGRKVAMIGNFRAATEAYARQIESILGDLGVRVLPVLLSELESDPDATLANLNAFGMAITMPSRLPQVSRLLAPLGLPVAAIAFQTSPATRQRLGAILPAQRIGVVATYSEFLSSLLSEIASYCLVQSPLLSAVLGQEERIDDMLGRIDILVYASGSDQLLAELPEGIEAIEYRYEPESDSVNRLRPLLGGKMAEMELGARGGHAHQQLPSL